jgi:hypothetical protein
MIQQAEWINEFCNREGFKFINCDEIGISVPCGLDKGYKDNDNTIFISGFNPRSKKIVVSYGGLKMQLGLKKPIEEVSKEGIKKHCIPHTFICARCGTKNLNLRTQDNHKTYVCPKCYKELDYVKSQTQADSTESVS